MTPARAEIEAGLRALAGRPAAEIDLADAALMLAAADRPRVALDRYRDHMGALVGDTDPSPKTAIDRARAIRDSVYVRAGYEGDRLTYDDLQNANLIRVIDRRRGLPVSLGILCLSVSRARGWPAEGLRFPGHFLIRIGGDGGAPVIVDPFDEGALREPADLRGLLQSLEGPGAELRPAHYAPADNREILIRLQTNIKMRLIEQGDFERAAAVAERMLWFAPAVAPLWQEFGLLRARLGDYDMAVAALETCIDRADGDRLRHDAARLLQEIRQTMR